MQNVLVTGASGFIGRHLVQELCARGCRVRCFVRSTSRVDHLDHASVEITRGSLLDPHEVAAAVAGVDTVFHVAGLTHAVDRREFEATNAKSSGVLADACRSQPKPPVLLYLSSLSAAGPAPVNGPPLTEEQLPRPVSLYGESKRHGELELQRRASEVPCSIVRPGVVFGPHDPGTQSILDPIHRFGLHLVVGFRTPPLSMIYVHDLVQLMLLAAEKGERLEGRPDGEYCSTGYYFACDDSEYPTYKELGQRFAAALNRRTLVWPLWRWVGFLLGHTNQQVNRMRGRSSFLNADKIREATVPSWACSASKARQQLGFAPAQDIGSALAATVDAYLKQQQS